MYVQSVLYSVLRVHPEQLTGEGGRNYIKVVDRIVKGLINRKNY